MRILCPMCGFGREVDEAKVPPRAQMATCPKCSHKFRFRVVDDLEPAAPAPSRPAENAAQPQPFDPSRAAAAEMWKRLQGPLDPPLPGEKTRDQRPANIPADASASTDHAEPDAQPSLPADSLGQDASASASMSQPAQPGPTAANTPNVTAADPAAQPEESTPWVRKPAVSPVPFEDLATHGFFPGMWATLKLVLGGPAAFFRAMPIHGGMAKPLAFHLLLAEVMVVCQYMWSLFGIGATAEYLGRPEVMDMGMGLAQAAPVMLFLIYPLLLVLRLMIMTGIIHLLLLMIRSGGSGAEATFRVLCYAAAPLLLGVIPGVGPVVGGLWSIGLTVIGLKQAHRTRTSAALFAVLVPFLMMLAAVIGLLQGLAKTV